MKKMFKNLMAMMICAILVVGTLASSMTVQAEETTQPATSGKCGDSAYWNYDGNTRTLTISGTGAMYDYHKLYDNGSSDTNEPWFYLSNQIKKLVIKNGITSVGNYNFTGFQKTTSVSLPKTLIKIGDYSFTNYEKLTTLTIKDSVKTIGISAFENCSKLKKLTIGKGVTKIGDYAFCKLAKTCVITIKSTKLKSVGTSVFYRYEGKHITIKLPKSKYDKYEKMISKSLNNAMKKSRKNVSKLSKNNKTRQYVYKHSDWKSITTFE